MYTVYLVLAHGASRRKAAPVRGGGQDAVSSATSRADQYESAAART